MKTNWISLQILLLLFCFSKKNYANNLTADSLQLVAFYNALDGPNWNNSWDLTQAIDTWWGVTLSDDGSSIKSIKLTFNNLTGNLPNLAMSSLEQIILFNNSISGTIPDFSNCPNLKDLSLSNNLLVGTLPNFSQASLELLFFANNQLTGEIPDFNLPNLLGLRLYENNLTGPIPQLLQSTKIQSIRLHENNLTGTIPNWTNKDELQTIRLADNNLTGEIPDFALPSLSYCNLSGNNLEGTVPGFNLCPVLEELDLSYNNLSGCYQPNICNILLKYFSNNPGLPDSGNLGTVFDFCSDNDSQLGLPCDDGNPNTIGEVITSNCECAPATHLITGNIFKDNNENCAMDTGENSLEGWLIKYEKDNAFYTNTDSLGNYAIHLDTGTYQISIIPTNIYWEPCFADTLVVLHDQNDTVLIDFPIQANYECSLLEVDVSTPFLRRCFPNVYTIRYCNQGTIPETNAYVEISFDEWLTINSSTIPWSTQIANDFTFPIGDLAVGECGSFQVRATLDCDSTVLGQVHCVEAHIFPDSICLPPNTLWDGSTIAVDGTCTGDSINFLIENIGDNDMSMPLNYIVIEDQIIHHNGNFQLQSQEQFPFSIETNGAIYRLEADQAAYHPLSTMPSVTVAGCGSTNWEFLNFFADPDQDPFVSIDCQENIGAFDPNDKRGFPKGIGEDHIIYPDTDLEYHIRFQNTGTDTAFNIFLRDTISDFLDIETLRTGTSSHAYEWQLFPDNMIEFRFNNIMLPDSNVNEAASHGFVKFKIKQQPDNLLGTLIENQAAIYFDFNDPIFTNKTSHQIGEKSIITDTIHVEYCETPFYTSDTSFTVSSNLSGYEIETTNHISIIGGQQSTLDLTLSPGFPFNGIIYQNDTTLYQIYEASNGCDSLVTINLDILTNLNPTLDAFSNISLSPNPSKGKVYILFDVRESISPQIELYNIQGQKLEETFNIKLSKGQQFIPLDWSHLNNGLYFIHITNDNIKAIKKLIINK